MKKMKITKKKEGKCLNIRSANNKSFVSALDRNSIFVIELLLTKVNGRKKNIKNL